MKHPKVIWFFALFWTGLALFPLACKNSWKAIPKDPTPHENCRPSKIEPQMLFVPGYGEAAIVVESCDKFRRERIAVAMKMFELAWYEKFGKSESVAKNLKNILMIFGSEKNEVYAAYDMSGKLVERAVLVGETISKDMIWVYASNETTRICDTSFIHELVHASIWAAGHDKGDPDHVGSAYHGWTADHDALIQDVNSVLCVVGI